MSRARFVLAWLGMLAPLALRELARAAGAGAPMALDAFSFLERGVLPWSLVLGFLIAGSPRALPAGSGASRLGPIVALAGLLPALLLVWSGAGLGSGFARPALLVVASPVLLMFAMSIASERLRAPSVWRSTWIALFAGLILAPPALRLALDWAARPGAVESRVRWLEGLGPVAWCLDGLSDSRAAALGDVTLWGLALAPVLCLLLASGGLAPLKRASLLAVSLLLSAPHATAGEPRLGVVTLSGVLEAGRYELIGPRGERATWQLTTADSQRRLDLWMPIAGESDFLLSAPPRVLRNGQPLGPEERIGITAPARLSGSSATSPESLAVPRELSARPRPRVVAETRAIPISAWMITALAGALTLSLRPRRTAARVAHLALPIAAAAWLGWSALDPAPRAGVRVLEGLAEFDAEGRVAARGGLEYHAIWERLELGPDPPLAIETLPGDAPLRLAGELTAAGPRAVLECPAAQIVELRPVAANALAPFAELMQGFLMADFESGRLTIDYAGRDLSQLWIRTPSGELRYFGALAGGARPDREPSTAARALPPAWLVSGLPPGRAVLFALERGVDSRRGSRWVRVVASGS